MADNTVTIYKYLDKVGLSTVWEKIKTNFASKAELNSVQNELDADIADINADIAGINSSIDEVKESVKVSAINSVDDLTIQANTDNKLSTALKLDIDTETQNILLVANGKNATDENKILSSISYKQFVKDGILDSVEMVIIEESNNTSGQEPGTYLKFTFNTDAGKDTIYVNVTDLVNVYKGEGYIIVQDETISLDYAKVVTDITNDLKATFVTLDDYNANNTSLNELISTNTASISELKEKLGVVETTVADHTAQITTLQEEVEKVKTANEELGLYAASLNETISNNTTQINSLWAKLAESATKEELSELDERVTVNETDIDTLETRIANLEAATGPDGELTKISITQVVDFAAMTEKDITEVCASVDNEDQTLTV